MTQKFMPHNVDLSLYLVTSSKHNDWLETVARAVKAGVTCVQYREKNISQEEFLAAGKKLIEILRPYHVPLIINDHVEAAIKLNAHGVHIGQNDMDVAEARRRLGKNKILGLTIENSHQAELCREFDVDYFGVGPVFPTQSKADAAPAIGITQLQKIRALIAKPLVAIGGINEKNLVAVLRTAVNGVAIVSAIMHATDPAAATQEIFSQIKNLRTKHA